MPRVDPERSFDAAARHVFRHICDAKALRRNPLLRTYFDKCAGDDGFALQEIHGKVIGFADALCAELEAKGSTLQARRRREIVAALCAGKPGDETAAELRISRSQYYREREAICAPIVRALDSAADTRDAQFVVREDPLRLVFARAEKLRDAGYSHEAVRILKDAYSRTADAFAKSTVGLGLAEELVFLGLRDQARELAQRERNASPGEAGAASDWLGDVRSLNLARLESQLGTGATAASALENVAKRRIAERRHDDLAFDAVFLSGECYRNSGAYDDARKMLGHLRGMEQRRGSTVAKRQIAVLLLAAYCAERSSDEFGLAAQYLREARDLSIASGTVVAALLATSGLAQYEAACGRDEAVYELAHESLRLADGVDFDGFLGYVVAEIVDALLQTRYWRSAAHLVFDAERLTAPETLRHALIKRAQGTFLFRSGRRPQAGTAMLEAYNLAQRLGNRKLEGLILRDRAVMLSDERSANQRVEFMREALRLIERFGSAHDLTVTYSAAARVLGDRRSIWLARRATMGPARNPEPGHDASYPARVSPLRLPPRST